MGHLAGRVPAAEHLYLVEHRVLALGAHQEAHVAAGSPGILQSEGAVLLIVHLAEEVLEADAAGREPLLPVVRGEDANPEGVEHVAARPPKADAHAAHREHLAQVHGEGDAGVALPAHHALVPPLPLRDLAIGELGGVAGVRAPRVVGGPAPLHLPVEGQVLSWPEGRGGYRAAWRQREAEPDHCQDAGRAG